MHAALILTPTDMRPFVGDDFYTVSYLVHPTDEFEPAVRHAVDAVFQDFQDISSDEFGLVSSYLDAITEPIKELKHFGLSIFAISTRGTMRFADGHVAPSLTTTHFLVVPTLGYFKVAGEDKKFHRFDSACQVAMSDLGTCISTSRGLTVRIDAQTIRSEFECNPPWCEHCCLSEIVAIAGTAVSVESLHPRITSKVVERAIADAQVLLETRGPTSAVDRVHTALHGYFKTVCDDEGIALGNDDDVTELFSRIRQYHPKFANLGEHEELVRKVLRGFAKVVDALNAARNRGSMAHPNEQLLGAPEATLFINAARTLLHYFDQRLSG